MTKENTLKQQVLEVILNCRPIIAGPIFGKDGFISPTNPSAKNCLTDARFIQLFPLAAKAVIPSSLQIDVVCGVESTGIAAAALVAYALQKPFAYVRKQAKPYGQRKTILGDVAGKRVLMVDDLIFYGETKDQALKYIRENGGEVVGLFVIFTMDPQSKRWAKQNKIPIIKLFDRQELYQAAVERGMISQALFDLEQTIYNHGKFMVWHTKPKLWHRYREVMQTDQLFKKSS